MRRQQHARSVLECGEPGAGDEASDGAHDVVGSGVSDEAAGKAPAEEEGTSQREETSPTEVRCCSVGTLSMALVRI